MGYRLMVNDRMEEDLTDAVEYYLQISPLIAAQFADTLVTAYTLLSVSPYFTARCDGVRHLPMKRFPYTLHYTVDERNHQVRLLGLLYTGIRAR